MKSLLRVSGLRVSVSRERETRALMVAVLGVSLKLHDLSSRNVNNAMAVGWKGQGERGKAYLLIDKLNQTRLILHNLISLIPTILKQLRQRKPLPRHLIPIIRIHKLMIIHTIRCIQLHLLDCGLAAVEVDDVVD